MTTTPTQRRAQPDFHSPCDSDTKLHAENPIPRGAVKRFREHLNAQDAASRHPMRHRHKRYHQRTRLYGDYLYAQDREKFMVDLREWLASMTVNAGSARSST